MAGARLLILRPQVTARSAKASENGIGVDKPRVSNYGSTRARGPLAYDTRFPTREGRWFYGVDV
jgi:hypothetical protein